MPPRFRSPWRVVAGSLLLLASAASGASGGEADFDRARCEPSASREDLSREESPAQAELRRANALQANGQHQEALAAYRASAAAARTIGDSNTAIISETNAVESLLAVDGEAAANAALLALEGRSLSIAPGQDTSARLQRRLLLGRQWHRLSKQLSGTGQKQAAARAAQLFREAAKEAKATASKRLESYATGYLAELYLEQDRLPEARTLTRRARVQAELGQAYDAIHLWHAQLARIETAEANPDAALAASRRAVAALARIRSDRGWIGSRAGRFFEDRVEPIYLQLVDLLLTRSRVSEPKAQQALLEESRDVLEGLKAEELRNHFKDPCLARQRTVSPDAVPGAVVFYPVLLEERVELIVGAKNHLRLVAADIRRVDLEERIQRFRRALPNRMFRAYRREAAVLYDALIRPIEDQLAAAETLVVVPSGALRQIPFSALFDEAESKYLIQKIDLATTPGLDLTDPRPMLEGRTRALAAGLSESVRGYAPLASVDQELESVAKTYPTETFLNAAFESQRFEKRVRGKVSSIVHIASHGEFRDDSSESFILTYDGQISMDRLARVIASTRFRTDDPLELLVLSACETAAGDDRAALGLAGVAVLSGARSALASLWSVNDEATALLIERFYAELKRGRSRAGALRAAQISLIEHPDFSHAANWAPFLLIGNWL